MAQEEKDVVISWFCDGAVAKDAFQRPTHFIQMPTPAPTPDNQEYDHQLEDIAKATGTWGRPLAGLLAKYAPGIRPARVAILGFSQGCRGPRAMLRSQDGRRIDTCLTFDGVHAQFKKGSKTDIDPGYLTAYAAFARMAAEGSRLFVDTTSSIKPPYPTVSTTQTSDWLWREATGSIDATAQNPLPDAAIQQEFNPPLVYPAGQAGTLVWPATTYEVAPLYEFRNQGAFWVLNYQNLDPTGHNDHVLQAQHILPMVVSTFLAARWNLIEPSQGVCVLSAGDDPSDPTTPDPSIPRGCFPPTRLSDTYLKGDAEPAPLDIDAFPNTRLPEIQERPSTPDPSATEDSFLLKSAKWAGGLLASALFLEGARRTGQYLANHPILSKQAIRSVNPTAPRALAPNLKNLSESQLKALTIADANNGIVFAGANHLRNGSIQHVPAAALRALERRGVVTLHIGPDGGMMARRA